MALYAAKMNEMNKKVQKFNDKIAEINKQKDELAEKCKGQSEEYIAREDVESCMDFLSCIEEIVCGACVLAVYAGEDWETRIDKYGYGADGYEYVEKYIKGGMDMSAIYGETDFHNDYMDYFKKNIKP